MFHPVAARHAKTSLFGTVSNALSRPRTLSFGLILVVNRLGAIRNAVGGGSPASAAGLGTRRMPPAPVPVRLGAGVQILRTALSMR